MANPVKYLKRGMKDLGMWGNPLDALEAQRRTYAGGPTQFLQQSPQGYYPQTKNATDDESYVAVEAGQGDQQLSQRAWRRFDPESGIVDNYPFALRRTPDGRYQWTNIPQHANQGPTALSKMRAQLVAQTAAAERSRAYQAHTQQLIEAVKTDPARAARIAIQGAKLGGAIQSVQRQATPALRQQAPVNAQAAADSVRKAINGILKRGR